mmetsp:Transcript_4855/g.8439  ORF Transcript_4855/g.8439 Transcript_4855/m.8439 type:complete len:172 (-) Transcript_4855:180-695(-)
MQSGLEFKHAQYESPLGEEWKPAVHPVTGKLLRETWISSMGRVLNSKGICTFGSVTPTGYLGVGIGGTRHFVHRLVLSSFAEYLPCYSWVANHMDGNKHNNTLENLQFATHAQNIEHAHRTDLRTPSFHCKLVLGRSLCSKEWIRFESLTAAATRVPANWYPVPAMVTTRL